MTRRTITLALSKRDEKLLAEMIRDWLGDDDGSEGPNRMLRRVLCQLADVKRWCGDCGGYGVVGVGPYMEPTKCGQCNGKGKVKP